jgi:type IV pilus assembly protein PilP
MYILASLQKIILPIMKKHLTIICNLACLIGFLTVLLGCDQPADKAAVPKVVRKKIHSQTAKKTSPPKTKSPTKPRPGPQATPAAGQVDTGKQAAQQPLIARKSEPPAVKSGQTVKPKPPVRPKSDISVTRQPSTQKSGVKTDINQKAMASTSPAEKAGSSSMLPAMYNPKGKPDPFEPLFRERKKRTPRTPLEKIDISQLKLVAIVLASSGNRALVEESSGKGYVVKKGTYMGTNSGKVVKIEKDKVIVAEEYEDYSGKVTLRNKEIKLPKPPGEL